LPRAGFLLGLLFDPEDRSTFFWNVSRLSPGHMELYPRKQSSS
jgi:hypothetical protein